MSRCFREEQNLSVRKQDNLKLKNAARIEHITVVTETSLRILTHFRPVRLATQTGVKRNI